MQIRNRDCIVIALKENNRITELQLQNPEARELLGNVYVGKVERVQENIRAAFIRTGDAGTCYYPLEEFRPEYVLNRNCRDRLKAGDELLVQVSKEALKEKLPAVTTNLTLSGKYLVLTSANRKLGYSSRLKKSQKEALAPLAEELFDGSLGMIFRTEAGEESAGVIRQEFLALKERMEKLQSDGRSRVCGTCLLQSEPAYIKAVRSCTRTPLDEIVTDIPEILENLQRSLSDTPALAAIIKKYEDPLLPLYKLHSLGMELEEALMEKVWLKSGGFLVIEQTEAAAVIDVNTGRYSDKKQAEETYLKVNLEAAAEAARQMRLRQLSGIILIDFINLSDEEHRSILMHRLREETAKDPVKTAVIDMTALQIVELTRQKTRKSLKEQFAFL